MTSPEGQWVLSPSGGIAVYGTWPNEDQERQHQTYTLQDAYQDVQEVDENDEHTALITAISLPLETFHKVHS